jgi:hypothetical protein
MHDGERRRPRLITAHAPELSIDPARVAFIIVKTREFHAKEGVVDPGSGSNPTDDREVDVLQARRRDAVIDELAAAIGTLDADEQADVLALLQVGRGEASLLHWSAARAEAADVGPRRLLEEILGDPLASDFLEDALRQFGHALGDYLNTGFATTLAELQLD